MSNSYGAEYKSGDIAELKKLFVHAVSQRNTTLQRELVKRVCAYMTLGIDVSPLFSDMIMVLLKLFISFYPSHVGSLIAN
jgi:vesicle coat complex subunit